MSKESHILFADDDADTRELVAAVLQAAGFRVSVTDTTEGALKLATTGQFDALLFDNWLPELTGVELCRRIRTLDQSTPILICSGAVTEADKEAAVSAGAQGYVSKPFNATDLVKALRSVLSKS